MRNASSPAAAVAGYVLAGGASSRFGRDKALVELGAEPVLVRMFNLVAQVAGPVNVVAPPERYRELELRTVKDRWPGQGPLGGIVTGLRTTERRRDAAWNLIVGCDMPFLRPDWLNCMIERAHASDADVIVPRSEHGLEPLCACWRTASSAALEAAFSEGVRKVTEAMKRLRMEVLDEKHWKRFDSAGQLFWNMNTPQDYEAARQMCTTERK